MTHDVNTQITGVVDGDPFAFLAEKFCPPDWCKHPVGEWGAVCNKREGHKGRHGMVPNDHPEAGSA